MDFYDFETRNVNLDYVELTVECLRKKRDPSYPVKTSKHVATRFALGVYYSEDVLTIKMNVFETEENL